MKRAASPEILWPDGLPTRWREINGFARSDLAVAGTGLRVSARAHCFVE
jgi:hypothetical protein